MTTVVIPESYHGFWLAQACFDPSFDERHKDKSPQNSAPQSPQTPGIWVHVAVNSSLASQTAATLRFMRPDLPVYVFPAWNCLPYDRLSPSRDVLQQRVEVFQALAQRQPLDSVVLITTPEVLMQRLAPYEGFAHGGLSLKAGDQISRAQLLGTLSAFGFVRQDVVREPGEFAVRGSLVDIFASLDGAPVRCDFLGDTLETLKTFDPLTQRTTGLLPHLSLTRTQELLLSAPQIKRFQQAYRQMFPRVDLDHDPLYQAVGEGRSYPGLEHWTPLFEAEMNDPLQVLNPAHLSLDQGVLPALQSFDERIQESYETRKRFWDNRVAKAAYAPLPPDALYLKADAVQDLLHARSPWILQTLGNNETAGAPVKPLVGTFQGEQRGPTLRQLSQGTQLVLTAWTSGGLARLQELCDGEAIQATCTILPLSTGFQAPTMTLVTEEDLFGKRSLKRSASQRSASAALQELAAFSPNDYVVHEDHGVGQYQGLEGITVNHIVHDCLLLRYAGGDKLYVPVENMNLVSRYGPSDMAVTLDKLGLPQWQARKAKVKKRLKEVAEYLLKAAAARALQEGPLVETDAGEVFDAFCRKFPYAETEDQLRAIEDTLMDLAQSRPMDRLICGDVGFGKTEVALRAAFMMVQAGYQVAVIVPTTLLARQHFQTFSNRFQDTGYRVASLSRLVSPKDADQVRADLASGQVHVVVATHALLRKDVAFQNLGLMIIDEEQHFGVAQKEKLKQLRANIHVLTLSATPIPRTLQMALSGLRELSLITTPPPERLAVETFILPFDEVVIREAILRERARGGQVFYVCPRLEHLETLEPKLRHLVPEITIAHAHGQMKPSAIETVMNDLEAGRIDLLLSTNIVESGIDIATANTLIVHRSDLFGLAQLYQLRGRVGRGRRQGYAYLTLPAMGGASATAQRRLEVMQSLDYLGAGFTLASHDMDIRGAGNLVGEEQSGHIKEVGIELYQHLLQQAVEDLQAERTGLARTSDWTPHIVLPAPVRIPETYVADLSLRLGLYRRVGDLKTPSDIDNFGVELVDRFGPLPGDVQNLLFVMTLKVLCKRGFVDKLEIGLKGALFSFYHQTFPYPETLIPFLAQAPLPCRLRPDHKISLLAPVHTRDGMRNLRLFLEKLGSLAHPEPQTI